MKQINTIENELLLYLRSIQTDEADSKEHNMHRQATAPDSYHHKNQDAFLPGKHVIHHIMGYARALSVLKRGDGERIFLLNN